MVSVFDWSITSQLNKIFSWFWYQMKAKIHKILGKNVFFAYEKVKKFLQKFLQKFLENFLLFCLDISYWAQKGCSGYLCCVHVLCSFHNAYIWTVTRVEIIQKIFKFDLSVAPKIPFPGSWARDKFTSFDEWKAMYLKWLWTKFGQGSY